MSQKDEEQQVPDMKLKEELQTVGFFYAMTGIYWISIGFMAAYWTIYLAEFGLDYSTIALIFLMYPIASLFFEIPTGAVADVYGKKISVFLSYFITGLAFVAFILSGANVPLLILFWFIAGISFTMESGALEAWFVDSVKHKKRDEHLHRLLGRWGGISSLGFVIGPLMGGVLVTYGVEKAFWASAVSMLFLSLFVLVFGREEYFERSKPKIAEGFKESFKTGRQGFRHAFKHPVILILTLVSAVMTFANTISFNAYQPYVVEVGLPKPYLGYALSVAGLITVFTLSYSHRIVAAVGGNKRSLVVFAFLMGLAVAGVGLIKYLPLLFLSLIAYTSFGEFAGYGSPAFTELFNKYVPSNIRATVISVNSFNMTIGQIIGLIGFGLISDHLGLQTGIVFAGIVIMAVSFVYLRVRDS
jgi:MFS family permease